MRSSLLFAGACLVMFLTSGSFAAPPDLQKINLSLVEPDALTIKGIYGQSINGEAFQCEAVTSLNGYQYVVFYDAQRHVCIGRRKLPDSPWQTIRLTDYVFKADDAHNTCSMGICPKDGTIHLAFDHHGDNLHYRVSKKGLATMPDDASWSPDSFGPVTDVLIDQPLKKVTYPGFLQTPEGNLQFLYRYGTSGAGQRWMVDYDGGTGKWRDNRQIDSGDGDFKDKFNASHNRNAYPNGFNYGPDGRLHYTWVWRENTQGANHDICYAYSDDHGKTWHNNAGLLVNSGDGKSAITLHTPGIVVVPIDRTKSLMNQEAQAVDHKGHIHVVVWHTIDGVNVNSTATPWLPAKSAYFHYWRDDNGVWQRNQIPGAIGDRPTLFFDKADNVYAVYQVNRDQAIWDHEIYFLDGQLTVATASAGARWKDWKIGYQDPGSYMSEPLGDRTRFENDGVLSIMVQSSTTATGKPAPLSILDLKPTP